MATFADGEVASGVLMLAATLATSLVVILGFTYGDRKFERFDIVCQLGAIVGVVLWVMFDSPEMAVIAAVTIDFVGALPTVKHSWQEPHEETWITFFVSGLGGLATVLALETWNVTGAVYPVYIFIMSMAIAVIILRSPHRKLSGEPAELREL